MAAPSYSGPSPTATRQTAQSTSGFQMKERRSWDRYWTPQYWLQEMPLTWKPEVGRRRLWRTWKGLTAEGRPTATRDPTLSQTNPCCLSNQLIVFEHKIADCAVAPCRYTFCRRYHSCHWLCNHAFGGAGRFPVMVWEAFPRSIDNVITVPYAALASISKAKF